MSTKNRELKLFNRTATLNVDLVNRLNPHTQVSYVAVFYCSSLACN